MLRRAQSTENNTGFLAGIWHKKLRVIKKFRTNQKSFIKDIRRN
jgi:hypothetical protein